MLPDTHLTQSFDSCPMSFSLCILKSIGLYHALLKKSKDTSLLPKTDDVRLEFSDDL